MQVVDRVLAVAEPVVGVVLGHDRRRRVREAQAVQLKVRVGLLLLEEQRLPLLTLVHCATYTHNMKVKVRLLLLEA